MKVQIEIDVEPGEDPADALRRHLDAVRGRRLFPMRVHLPEGDRYEVRVPAFPDAMSLTVDACGTPDLYFEIRRMP